VTAAAGTTSAQAEILSRLRSRLPAEGPILALGTLAAEHAPQRPHLERRALAPSSAHALGVAGPVAPAVLEPGSWHAIVISPDPRIRDWTALLTTLRRALIDRGLLFVILPDLGTAASDATSSDAVAALYETGFCVVHEDEVALVASAESAGEAPRGSTPIRARLIESRVDDHLVRSYREGDEAAILALFAASFTPPRGHDHWRWKYRDNPFGTLAISCAFAPSGELVAHYAAYPVRFRRSRRRSGETLLCHQVGDTMTDRHYRHVGRGRTSLLGRASRHFYATRCDGRVAFNYGFNTGNIQRFSQLFVGARKVWDVELRRSTAGGLALDAQRRFRRYRASRVDRLDAAFDDFFERVAPHHGLLVERRRPYLEWRYLRCPDRRYHLLRVDQGSRLVGWGVFRLDGDRLLWGDALFDPEHSGAVSALLREALAIFDAAPGTAASDDRRVEGWFSRHPPWWSEELERLGFASASEPQGLGMVFVPFLECPDQELATGYYLAMGDSDLF
jgi:hypothetical protein